MEQMKEQIKTPEKELNEMEISPWVSTHIIPFALNVLILNICKKFYSFSKNYLQICPYFVTILNQFCERPDYQCFELCI